MIFTLIFTLWTEWNLFGVNTRFIGIKRNSTHKKPNTQQRRRPNQWNSEQQQKINKRMNKNWSTTQLNWTNNNNISVKKTLNRVTNGQHFSGTITIMSWGDGLREIQRFQHTSLYWIRSERESTRDYYLTKIIIFCKWRKKNRKPLYSKRHVGFVRFDDIHSVFTSMRFRAAFVPLALFHSCSSSTYSMDGQLKSQKKVAQKEKNQRQTNNNNNNKSNRSTEIFLKK